MLVGIVGATGYQGSWTVRKLHEREYRVRALVRKTSDISAIEPFCEVRVVDFDSQSCIRDALQGIEVLIMCLSRRRGSDTTHFKQDIKVFAKAGDMQENISQIFLAAY